MKDNNKAIVSDSLLVETRKSSRLATIRQKIQQPAKDINKQTIPFVKELKPESRLALEQSINLIEQSMSEILEIYPTNKKNTFFKIKYGIKIGDLRTMSIKQVFFLLHIQTSRIDNFRLIENLGFNGQKIEM